MLLESRVNSYSARGINLERLEAILENAGHSILDVGCGSGAYVIKLAKDYDIRGVDIQKYEPWEAMPNLFSISDAAELDWKDNSVDTILSFETLEHLQFPEKALREYYRVCRKNIILTVPDCDLTPGMSQSQLIHNHWIDRTHVQFFNMESIIDMIKGVGFKIKKSYYINQISLSPFITEAFELSSIPGRLIRKLLLKRQKHRYYLTCLVVAEKE
jgi:ubiquinone/menaquinone biosynthesis C-methylase UbiE